VGRPGPSGAGKLLSLDDLEQLVEPREFAKVTSGAAMNGDDGQHCRSWTGAHHLQ
jgi:hypothetical protein